MIRLRSARRVALPSAFALLLGAAALSVPQRGEVEVVTHEVAGAVHYLEGRGGNIGVSAGEDGVLIVDDQFQDMAPQIEAALAKLSPAAPRFLVNTHWHRDHTDGNAHFGKKATVIAHRNVRRRLASDPEISGTTASTRRWEVPPQSLPTITYDDGLSIHFNGEEIRLVHFPNGHTDGDSVVWFTGSNAVHMGDMFFSVAFPYIDLGSGGSIQGLVDNLDAVLEMVPADVKVIAGHGPQTDLDGLRRYRDMVAEVITRVSAALDDGKDLDAMRADGLLDDLARTWEPEGAFIDRDRMLQIAVESLSR